MLELRVNSNVIRRLRQTGFYPDTMLAALMTMKCLKENNTGLLDVMDDSSNSKRAMLIYYDLLRKGYLEEDTSEESKSIYKLSKRGMDLVDEIDALTPVTATVEVTPPSSDDVESWINEFVNTFPEGVVSGGKLVRSDKKSCLIKMKKFIKDYPEYGKDTVLRATRMYVDQFDDTNPDKPSFMKCAVYFIDKRGEGSELAGWCVKASKQEDMSDSFIHSNNGLV